MTTFMGIEIGKRSIVTHQVALDVTGHNIANANTVGYSRQAANVVTSLPWHTPVLVGNARVGQLGTGSEVSDIQRYRDSFIDDQIRNENRTAGYWKGMQEGLAQIEGILNEPTEEGLRGVMDTFWESWQDLSANPESESARSVVNERALGMVETFNHAFRQLTELRDDVNASVKIEVDAVNSLALQIKDLNKQILAITIAGKQPNDLLDKRDLLIDELSGLVEIKVYNEPNKLAAADTTGLSGKYNGTVSIIMGGRALVQGDEVCQLDVSEPDALGMNMVVWKDTRTKAKIEGGELKGLLDMRGRTRLPGEINSWDSATADFTGTSEYKDVIPTMIANLNKLAQTVIQKTNDVHRSGYSLNNKTAFPDGNNFFQEPDPLIPFDGNWARFMQVDSAITEDIKNINAASNRTWNNDVKVNFGDGSNALRIAQLKHSLNQQEYTVKTDSLNKAALEFGSSSNTISGSITIGYNTSLARTITLDPPSTPYQDLQQLAAAIQKELDEDAALSSANIFVYVRCDGDKLSFYSTSPNFLGVNDGDTYTGTGAAGGPAANQLLKGAVFGTLPSPVPDNPLVEGGTTDDFWRSRCADIGVQSQEAQRMVKNQDQLIGELENKRQSLSGVSLDEEMTNMIKFQHAYNAASRFITTMDEQLNTIINGMGLVGR